MKLFNGVYHCPLELCLVLHKIFCRLQVVNISVSVVHSCCWLSLNVMCLLSVLTSDICDT